MRNFEILCLCKLQEDFQGRKVLSLESGKREVWLVLTQEHGWPKSQ